MSVFELIWVKMICRVAVSAVLALSMSSTAFSQDTDPDTAQPLTAERVSGMEIPPEIENSLSDFFVRASNLAASGSSRLAMRLFHISVLNIFSELAVELDPDSLAAWQLRLQTLSLMDSDAKGADASKLKVFEEITRLDPDDEVIRLRRLLYLINEKQTEEERVRLFEVFLDPANEKVIGTQVSARLALQLAQLLYRTGDTEGYLTNLSLAVELDPFFPDATSELAGYLKTTDPEAQVELLIVALIANPLEAIFAAQIGAQALDAGDFSSAARMIGLARSSIMSRGMDLSEFALLQARSLWGAGRLEEAKRVLSQLSLWEKKSFQRQAKTDDPLLTDTELQQLEAPLNSSMALLESVMLMESGDKQKHRTYVDETLVAFVLALDSDAIDPTDLQQVNARSQELVEMIAFAAWQGEDVAIMESLIDELSQHVVLTDLKKSMYAAWKQYARGRYSAALAAFESIGEEDRDTLTLLGMSLANDRLGNKKDAARLWLKIVGDSPGDLIGIWARNQLEATLNTTIPQSEQAKRLSAQISEIPSAVDRILLNRERAYSMSIKPVIDPVGPFEALRYRLTLSNRSGIPLAIGPSGSLDGKVAVLPTCTISGMQGEIPNENLVESIDRQFSIEPSEVLEFEFNIGNSQIGQSLSSAVLKGANVGLRVISNYDYISKPVTGDFSIVATSPLLRVDGVPNGKPWRRDALASARRLDGFQSLKDLALLLFAANESLDQSGADGAEMEAFREEVLDLYTMIYADAPEQVRAWLASVLPGTLDNSPEFSTINTLVVLDDAPLVVAVTLVSKVWGVAGEREAKAYIASTIGKRTGRVQKLAQGLTDIIAQDENMKSSE